jgi:endonuclease YncB( thermonuclease family)
MSARVHPYRRPQRTGLRLAMLCALVFAAPTTIYVVTGRLTTEAAATTVPPDRRDGGAVVAWADIRVTDGDTFRVREERVRIANIDTPEMPGRARCDSEAQLALAAKARLGQLLSHGDIRLSRQGLDRYGRTLATVSAGSGDVGEQLVRERLAQRWMGRKATWC